MKAETREQVEDLLLWCDDKSREIVQRVCREEGVDIDALADLVAWQRAQQERQRRLGMTEVFDEVFDNRKYWG